MVQSTCQTLKTCCPPNFAFIENTFYFTGEDSRIVPEDYHKKMYSAERTAIADL